MGNFFFFFFKLIKLETLRGNQVDIGLYVGFQPRQVWYFINKSTSVLKKKITFEFHWTIYVKIWYSSMIQQLPMYQQFKQVPFKVKKHASY